MALDWIVDLVRVAQASRIVIAATNQTAWRLA
jgi:hypothetical protein